MELKEYIESAEIQRMWDMQEILRVIQYIIGIFGFCIFIGAFIMIMGIMEVYNGWIAYLCYCIPAPELVINNYIILATIIIEGILSCTILYLERKIRRLDTTK